MRTKIESLEDALTAFMDGARIHHGGAYLGDKRMAIRGLKRTNNGLTYIDEHSPNARDILIPLLSHAEDEVRVTAASALLQSHPDLAIPVIQEIRVRSYSEARTTAGLIMIFKSTFGHFGLGVAKPDPRFPSPASEGATPGVPLQ